MSLHAEPPEKTALLGRARPASHPVSPPEAAARRAMRRREVVILALVTLMMVGAWALALRG